MALTARVQTTGNDLAGFHHTITLSDGTKVTRSSTRAKRYILLWATGGIQTGNTTNTSNQVAPLLRLAQHRPQSWLVVELATGTITAQASNLDNPPMTESAPAPAELSPTEKKAAQLLTRWAKVAQRDNLPAGGHGVKIHPDGALTANGIQGTRAEVMAYLVERLDAPKEPKELKVKEPAGPMSWDRLNQATQDYFFTLCEQIQEATKDHGMTAAARLGHDIPKVLLADAPRLTNLKKAGLVESTEGEKKSHRLLSLTDAGRALWATRS